MNVCVCSRPQAALGEEEKVQLLKAEECYAKASALDPRCREPSPVDPPRHLQFAIFK